MPQFQQRVYLLRRDGLHKIGLSWNAPYRATALDATVIHEIVTDDAAWAEATLHERYAGCRLHGEWFDLSPSQVEEIRSVTTMDRPPCGSAPVPLGCRLQALRRSAGLTQEALSGLAGMPATTYADIERGRIADPRLSQVRRVAGALGLTVGELLGEDQPGFAQK